MLALPGHASCPAKQAAKAWDDQCKQALIHLARGAGVKAHTEQDLLASQHLRVLHSTWKFFSAQPGRYARPCTVSPTRRPSLKAPQAAMASTTASMPSLRAFQSADLSCAIVASPK